MRALHLLNWLDSSKWTLATLIILLQVSLSGGFRLPFDHSNFKQIIFYVFYSSISSGVLLLFLIFPFLAMIIAIITIHFPRIAGLKAHGFFFFYKMGELASHA